MYWFVLKISWLCIYGPWLIIGIGLELFTPSSGAHPGAGVSGIWEPFFRSLFIQFAVVTGVFATLDRYHSKGWLNDWNPRKHLPVRDPNRVRRSSSISELAWYAVLLLWWVNLLRIPIIPGIQVHMTPTISRYLFWPILVLVVCQGMIACLNAFRPQWNPRRAALRGIVDGLSLLVVSYLLAVWIHGGTFVAVASAKLSLAQTAAAEKGITYGWSVLLLIWAASAMRRELSRTQEEPPASRRYATGQCNFWWESSC